MGKTNGNGNGVRSAYFEIADEIIPDVLMLANFLTVAEEVDGASRRKASLVRRMQSAAKWRGSRI